METATHAAGEHVTGGEALAAESAREWFDAGGPPLRNIRGAA